MLKNDKFMRMFDEDGNRSSDIDKPHPFTNKQFIEDME